MFNNEQDFEEWRVDCLNKAKEILTMDKEKENNRSKKNRDDSELTVAFIFLCKFNLIILMRMILYQVSP